MSGGFQNLGALCNAQSVGDVVASTTFTTVTTNGNSPGSWVQLTASLAGDCVWALCQIDDNNQSNSDYLIDIGVGGAGSEVAVGTFYAQGEATTASATLVSTYGQPLSIPAGSRVSARATASSFGMNNVNVKLILFDGAFADDGQAGSQFLGSANTGVSVAASASANTKGSYTQIIASTARDYIGVVVGVTVGGGSGNPSRFMADIAIGAAGSEQVILPNLAFKGPNFNTTQWVSGFIPIEIPSGTRIAARLQEDNTNANTQTFYVFGVYR